MNNEMFSFMREHMVNIPYILLQSTKILLVPPKYELNFGAILKYRFFQNSCCSIRLLKLLVKSNSNLFAIALRARKSNNYRSRNMGKCMSE